MRAMGSGYAIAHFSRNRHFAAKFGTEGTFRYGVDHETGSFRFSHYGTVNWPRLCAIDHHDYRRVVELDNKDNAEHYDQSADGFDHHEWNKLEIRQGLRSGSTNWQRQAGSARSTGYRCQLGCSWPDEKDHRRLLTCRTAGFFVFRERKRSPAVGSKEEPMKKDGHGRVDKDNQQLLARRLSEEVGISEPDARGLIKLIGTDWNSLLREARFLKERH
ncbi:hypothetical protein [Mesorhizobium sp. M7A.F.Ca.US.011.01.1.1]|uniref:hypothetical protein n=1 Tax=Mesorhizobium sp. M7A.F.Ca.US.011.01.1.1 TaxID=2496741 RepID=UPI0013E38692|nr:hypothetical protein [Mesorhizobium sp. M7A.F.Ca.US.011.01.1.1]